MKFLLALKQRWQQLAIREQVILFAGSIIVVILLAYQFIYSPFQEAIAEKQQAISNQEQLLAWMKKADEKIERLQVNSHEKKTRHQKSLLTVAAESLKKNALTPTAIGQAANDKITITFNVVSFNQLIQWLVTLWQTYGIEVYQATITAKEETGMVEANLILQERSVSS